MVMGIRAAQMSRWLVKSCRVWVVDEKLPDRGPRRRNTLRVEFAQRAGYGSAGLEIHQGDENGSQGIRDSLSSSSIKGGTDAEC